MSAQRQTPLWLWPNLLSLDAPVVALCWQWLFARAFGAALGAAPAALLAATVWLIYTADRALDARRGAGNAARHEFYLLHWREVSPLWLSVFAAAAWAALSHFPRPLFLRGAALLCAVLVYLAAVHLSPAWLHRWWPKEAVVGVLFALGASLVAWPKIRTPADVAVVALFGALCWVNCQAIDRWERHFDWRAGIPAAAIAGIAILLLASRPRLGGALLISSLAFVALDLIRKRCSSSLVRVLADVALLTPLLFLQGVFR